MFTGLIEATARVVSTEHAPSKKSLIFVVDASELDDWDIRIGDSVAVNGCCLTVTKVSGSSNRCLHFDVSTESLNVTNIGGIKAGEVVNLERAAKLGARMGGHIVSGHVDGLVWVLKFQKSSDGSVLEVSVPAALAKYMIHKGSACLNGVSLTINSIEDRGDTSVASFMLIPETLRKTTLGELKAGHQINLEVDLMAKFAERLQSFT